MKKLFLLLTVILIVFAFSCTRKNEEQPVFTKQIQYDVQLKNPDTIPDDRHRYMDDSSRIVFLKKIIDAVLAGEDTAYVWKNSRLVQASLTEFKDRIERKITKVLPDNRDTVIVLNTLDDVSKIRYIEEWRLYKMNHIIEKRIFAISLLRDSYSEQGEYRGTEPLFYLFYDREFITEYEKMYFE